MIRQNPNQLFASGFAASNFGMSATQGTSSILAKTDHVHAVHLPSANNLTALAGGAKSGATLMAAVINRFTTVASANDSALLPASAAGLYVVVINNTANAMQIYGSGTDTINGVATGTGISLTANSVGIYFCPVAGVWFGGKLS